MSFQTFLQKLPGSQRTNEYEKQKIVLNKKMVYKQ